nr:MAG TPA: hypothetical protein [Caudoviricetes sp.]
MLEDWCTTINHLYVIYAFLAILDGIARRYDVRLRISLITGDTEK